MKKKFINNIGKDKLLGNFFSLMVLKIFTYILPLITLPYLVRVLEVERFGLVMFAQSLTTFFAIFVDYGFNLSATREISLNRDNKNKLTEIFSSVMLIKFIHLIISFCFLSMIIIYFDRFNQDIPLYMFSFLSVVGQMLFPLWYFQGIEKMKYITIINVISKLLFTISIFVFIDTKEDYILVPILNGFGFIVGGILSLIIIYKEFNQIFVLQPFKTLLYYFKDSSQFFLSRVSVMVYTSANAFILGLFVNTSVVGYYAIAEKLYIAFHGLYQPVVQVLYPYVAKQKDIVKFKKIYIFVIFINIFIIIIAYYLTPFMVFMLSGKYIVESIEAFRLFLILLLIVVPSIMIGYPFLAALGYKWYANYSVVYGSISYIIALLTLMYFNNINIKTIIYSIFVTEFIVLSIRYYGVWKYRLWEIKK